MLRNKLMNLDITNENLYLLLPCKISRVVQIYSHEHNLSLIEAMRCFTTRIHISFLQMNLQNYGIMGL